ncbi:MAG: TetR family transcriptional regulator [Inquilinus sp.]|nr:TetR family transcriptional regulator [Inquilinus sp.]
MSERVGRLERTAGANGTATSDTAVDIAEAAARRPPGGRTRRLNEARILEAAEAVFAEAGFTGASMQAIAEKAGLPKANLHYYFGTKEGLYRTLLSHILDMWVDAFEHIAPERDPAEALAAYIRDKMRWSRTRPLASKVFANEVIHGAQQIEGYLGTKLRSRVEDKAKVIEGWIATGRMAPVDPKHLFFSLWATTQTYADFEVQVRRVLGCETLGSADYDHATDQVIGLMLRGCGLVSKNG